MSATATDVHENTDQADDRTVQPGGLLPAVLKSEWTKLRSVRSTMWALLATIGITVGFGSLFCLAYTARYDRLDLAERRTVDPTLLSLRGLFLSSLAIGVLGVLVMSAEYATGMIRATLTAVPQRRIVLAAKAIVFGAVALVVSIGSAFVAFGAGQAILARKHLGTSLTDPTVLRAVLGAGAYLTIVGLLGLALGTILRRTAGAIATLVGLVFIADLLVQALPSPWNSDIGKFLPGNAGLGLFSVRHNSDRLTPGAALVVLLVWLAVALILAAITLTRRDA
jgi:ABC-2 type transport system permease protein